MNLTAAIHERDDTGESFAAVNIVRDDGQRLCALDLQYSVLARLPAPRPAAVDFLLTASAVYAIDKLVRRETATDAWTREIGLTVQVSDPDLWTTVAQQFSNCISFLTGDVWTLRFTRRPRDPVRPRVERGRRRRAAQPPRPRGDAVSLFSGGLDSLVGVIDWLEENPQGRLLLVGHHDGDMAGPFGDQRALLAPLTAAYPGRLASTLLRVGHADEATDQTEITLRGRSLIFVALGVFAASTLGPQVTLLIPENGTIALNVPLTPSRRGSCSTRTAHPHYLATLAATLRTVGLTNPLTNPLRHKTKGEVLTGCCNLRLLARTARLAVSCAKRGHKVHWTRRNAASCGRCMPCIYRRAAMHAAGWDDEVYGDDICVGEVDLADAGEKSNDLRACFSFLKANPREEEVASMLMASGSLDVRELSENAAMVRRTMDEIRALLRDKATADIRRLVVV